MINRSLKILHCIPSMHNGGAERQLSYLCHGLTRLNISVTVALLEGGANMSRLLQSGAQIHMLDRRSIYDPLIVDRLVRLIQQWKPDIIQTWLPTMDIYSGLARAFTRPPMILSERNSALAYHPNWRSRLRVILHTRLSCAIIANSQEGLAYWKPKLRRDTRLYCVRNAIPTQEIDAIAPASRRALGFEDRHEIILFAGSFTAKKNLETLFEALARVFAQRPRAVALICGDGSSREQWEQWTAERNLSQRVHFFGYVDNLWALMKMADVVVSTSIHEGQPNVVLEAMGAQCPLVVSDIPEHREFLSEENAILAPPHDPERFAQAIDHALSRPDVAQAMVARARRWTEDHDIERMADQYVQIYEDILQFCPGTKR